MVLLNIVRSAEVLEQDLSYNNMNRDVVFTSHIHHTASSPIVYPLSAHIHRRRR